MCYCSVETLRKPSTGLKRSYRVGGDKPKKVETLRKPSTGLKRPERRPRGEVSHVETLRKPSTGLKHVVMNAGTDQPSRRDTQKTQHGIETRCSEPVQCGHRVETLRKPSTGLKQYRLFGVAEAFDGRDTQKTQHGIETYPWSKNAGFRVGRDTQKTQHGIETPSSESMCVSLRWSRHSENPARD